MELGDTALHLAAAQGRTQQVERLMERSSGSITEAQNTAGETPLHRAVANGHVDVVRILIGGGANIEASDKEGYTPLHHAAVSAADDAAKELLANGANVDALAHDGWSPLTVAAAHGHATVVTTLLKAGANTEVVSSGKTADALALDSPKPGSDAAAGLILAWRASPRAPRHTTAAAHRGSRFSESGGPLAHAFESSRASAGAGTFGWRAPRTTDGQRGLERSPGAAAAAASSTPAAEASESESSADSDSDAMEGPPRGLRLHGGAHAVADSTAHESAAHTRPGAAASAVASDVTAASEMLDCVERRDDVAALRMIRHDAVDPNLCRDDMGNTALHLAVGRNLVEVARGLVRCGADVDAVNVLDLTSLHLAAQFGHVGIAKILLDAGADPTMTCEGKTALQLADVASEEVSAVLRAHMAQSRVRAAETRAGLQAELDATKRLLEEQGRMREAAEGETERLRRQKQEADAAMIRAEEAKVRETREERQKRVAAESDARHERERRAAAERREADAAAALQERRRHKAAEQLTRVRHSTIVYPWEELRASTDGFSDAREIGSGGFGSVYRAALRGDEVAVKRLTAVKPLGMTVGVTPLESLRMEVEALGRFRHERLLMLKGVCLPGDGHDPGGAGAVPCIVYEYMPGGSLAAALDRDDAPALLPWHRRLVVAEQTAHGLCHLHTGDPERIMVHLDVKPDNILMDAAGDAKLGDAGLVMAIEIGVVGAAAASGGAAAAGAGAGAAAAAGAGAAGSSTRTVSVGVSKRAGAGTPDYMAPEYLRGGHASIKCDSYSFGVTLAELVSGRPPADITLDPPRLIEAIETATDSGDMSGAKLVPLCDSRIGWPLECATRLWALVQSCCHHVRTRRCTMADVLVQLRQLLDDFPQPPLLAGAGDATSGSGGAASGGEAPAASRDSSSARGGICIVCDDRRRTVVLLCGHMFCSTCVEELVKRKMPCPYKCDSEKPVTKFIKAHVDAS